MSVTNIHTPTTFIHSVIQIPAKNRQACRMWQWEHQLLCYQVGTKRGGREGHL